MHILKTLNKNAVYKLLLNERDKYSELGTLRKCLINFVSCIELHSMVHLLLSVLWLALHLFWPTDIYSINLR